MVVDDVVTKDSTSLNSKSIENCEVPFAGTLIKLFSSVNVCVEALKPVINFAVSFEPLPFVIRSLAPL